MAQNPASTVREPYTREELERLTVKEELEAEFTADELALMREINNARQSERLARIDRLRVELAAILEELRRVGWDSDNVLNCPTVTARNPAAVPILLKHLLMPHSDTVREGIADFLAVALQGVRAAWSVLVKEYRNSPTWEDINGPGLPYDLTMDPRCSLANFLSAAVTDETLPELIALAEDRALGRSRMWLLPALRARRNKHPLAAHALDQLAMDPELADAIGAWKMTGIGDIASRTSRKGSPERAPCTRDELRRMNVEENIEAKLTEDEMALMREIMRDRNVERQAGIGLLRAELEPLRGELRDAGCDVETLFRTNTTEKYPETIPILLKHLVLPYSDRARTIIASCLSVPSPAVKNAWPILVREYRKAPFGKGIVGPGDTEEYELGAKDRLANVLSAAVTDATMEEFIGLVKDRTLGDSRILLLMPLYQRRNRHPLIMSALEELAADPHLAKQIDLWKQPHGQAS